MKKSITAAVAMMLIGSQSALAATACKSLNENATITINSNLSECQANAINWLYSAAGGYTCPCIGNQPTVPTITCNAGSGSSNGSSAYPGQWDCDGTTTVANSGVTVPMTNITVTVICQNAFGSASASASDYAICEGELGL
jgi:hypothetical protein